MVWLPTAKPPLLQVAARVLPLPAKAPAVQPLMALPPSVKLTVPLGALPLTVAVKVTLCPNALGLADELSTVVVPLRALLTVWATPGEALPLKLLSPA